MNKKILVISSSLRSGGNSETLADAFMCGAKEAGNEVEKISFTNKNISFCKGWMDCFPKAQLVGTVLASGVDAMGEISGHPALQEAFDLGKAITGEV